MTTTAKSRVETLVDIRGDDKASEVVRSARESVDGLAEAGGEANKAFTGIKDILGDVAEGPLQRFAEVAGGLESVITALPGPMGAAAAGIAIVGAGAALLYTHIRETEAKLRELGDDSTRELREQLDLSADAAVRLSNAFADLPLKLQPTRAALADVRDRAESIGKDGEEAVSKFVEALAKGPSALREFEREFGRIARATNDIPTLAEQLGLDPATLGLVEQTGNEAERARKLAEESLVLRRQSQQQAEIIARIEKQIDDSFGGGRIAGLTAQRDSLVAQRAILERTVAETVREANALQQVVERQKAATAAAQERQQAAADAAQAAALLEAQAGVLLDQREALQTRLAALSTRSADVERQRLALQTAAASGLVDEVSLRRGLNELRAKELQIAAAELTLARNAAAERRQRASTARAASDAEIAARLRVAEAQASALEAEKRGSDEAVAARLRVIELREAADTAAARRATNTARGRALAVEAVELESANRRVALERSVSDFRKSEADKLAQERARIEKESLAAATAASQQIVEVARVRSSRLAEAARADGDFERAALVERAQAWADYQQQLIAIDAQLADRSKAAGNDAQRLATVERAALEARASAAEEHAARVARANDDVARAQVESAQRAVDAASSPLSNAAAQIGGSISEAVGAATQGAQAIATNWQNIGAAAPSAISAAGAVAAAFIDNERQKAGVLAAMEAAASIASFVSQDYAGGVGHAAAAALYAGVAGGVIGGGATPAAPAAATGGGSAPSSSASSFESSSTGGAQPGAVVVNFNGILTTRSEVARGAQKLQRSLRGTGYR